MKAKGPQSTGQLICSGVQKRFICVFEIERPWKSYSFKDFRRNLVLCSFQMKYLIIYPASLK